MIRFPESGMKGKREQLLADAVLRRRGLLASISGGPESALEVQKHGIAGAFTERLERNPGFLGATRRATKQGKRLGRMDPAGRFLAEKLGLSSTFTDALSRQLSKKTVLVLSGGGAKGSFEAGALAYLRTRWDENQFSWVVGTSVGAVNALPISARGSRGIPFLVDTYLSLEGPSSFFAESAELKEIERVLEQRLGTSLEDVGTGDLDTMAARLNRIEKAFLVNDITSWLGALPGLAVVDAIGDDALKAAIQELMKALRAVIDVVDTASGIRSLYDLSPLQRLIFEQFDVATVGDELPLRMCMADLVTGSVCYMTEEGRVLYGNADPGKCDDVYQPPNSREINLVLGATASAAMPGLFPEESLIAKYVQDSSPVRGRFVDGGLHGALPMKAAVDLGADRVVAISASPVELDRHDPRRVFPLFHNARRALDIVSHQLTESQATPLGGWCDNVARIHIRPLIRVHGFLEVHPGLVRINIDYGYMRAHDYYRAGRGELEDLNVWRLLAGSLLAETITELRMEVLELEKSVRPLPAGGLQNRKRLKSFRKATLDRIRALKHEVAAAVETRIAIFGSESVPLEIDGVGIRAEDWWLQWETQAPGDYSYSLVTEFTDPWSPLPVYDEAIGVRWESASEVPAAPSPQLA
jgi:hypothetical protein